MSFIEFPGTRINHLLASGFIMSIMIRQSIKLVFGL